MNKIKFEIGNKELYVLLSDLSELKKQVLYFKDIYYSENEGYVKEKDINCMLYEIYTDKYSSYEDVCSDIDSMLDLIEKIETNPEEFLKESVEKVRKKKNGLFWLKSGYTIQSLDYCTEYFTDFTNAWSTPELRLDVLNETECELSLRYYTRTL